MPAGVGGRPVSQPTGYQRGAGRAAALGGSIGCVVPASVLPPGSTIGCALQAQAPHDVAPSRALAAAIHGCLSIWAMAGRWAGSCCRAAVMKLLAAGVTQGGKITPAAPLLQACRHAVAWAGGGTLGPACKGAQLLVHSGTTRGLRPNAAADGMPRVVSAWGHLSTHKTIGRAGAGGGGGGCRAASSDVCGPQPHSLDPLLLGHRAAGCKWREANDELVSKHAQRPGIYAAGVLQGRGIPCRLIGRVHRLPCFRAAQRAAQHLWRHVVQRACSAHQGVGGSWDVRCGCSPAGSTQLLAATRAQHHPQAWLSRRRRSANRGATQERHPMRRGW